MNLEKIYYLFKLYLEIVESLEPERNKITQQQIDKAIQFLNSGRLYLICLLSFIFLSAKVPASAQAIDSLHRYQFLHKQMGTLFRIVLHAPDSTQANQAASSAFQRVDQLNDILSDYKAASELNQLSATAGTGQKVQVSPDLWYILTKSTEASKLSNGVFDITAGPYSKLWRRSRRQGELPSQEALAKAKKSVGYQHIRFFPHEKAIELTMPGMQLDLGAIGKGYAVDEAMKVLTQHGISSALVDGGGNIAVRAAPPGQQGWQVEIGSLPENKAPASAMQQVSLTHAGMASSGDLYQFVEIAGKRYSHIIDPQTGLGLTHQVMVTVIAADGTTADLLSTTISIVGLKKGKKLLKKYKAKACYVQYPDGNMEKWEAN
ncbi:FAD:protein FMN transferase [Rhodocytophaga aerolata]|uniref:FAD:protein FMN transferase n=1 Tax=Rhodocytophaga aerolata TaxID=455078 RepID=A0ABT8RAJ9_9BACT|nr:FAD:protein FMN transferase [Rhodocytophaga aerolata]MDO1449107.1 FAD:protein FMN transferase [Rhodocytophaga aerolata]